MYFLLEMHWQYTYRNDIMNFYSKIISFFQIIEYISSPIFPLIILGIIGLKIGNDENGINKM